MRTIGQLPTHMAGAARHRPPVFCLYGIGGDVCHNLELSKALGPDQPVFGIRSHALDPSTTDPLPDSGRSHWTGRPVQVHWLETDHVAVLRAPVVNELAARLRALMDQHYAAQNGPARRQ